jgi:hypothetical protein
MVNFDKWSELCNLWDDEGSDAYQEAEDRGENFSYKDFNESWFYNKYGIADDDRYYEVPTEFCPICQMIIVSDRDIVNYAVKLSGHDRKELAAQIKERFNTYDKFLDFIKDTADEN